MSSNDLPLYKVRCCFCADWETVQPREIAQWGYCGRWSAVESARVSPLAGLTLIESDPSQLDRKPVVHESFGGNRIRRIDAEKGTTP